MKSITFTLLLFITTVVTAQVTSSLKMTESETFTESKYASEIISLHTDSKGNTGVVRKGKRNILFDVLDNNLNKVDNRFLQITRKESFIGEYFYDGKIRIFTVLSPKKRERILNCYTYNLENKLFDQKVLFHTTVEKKKNLFRARNRRQTNFAASPDGNYFVVNTDNVKKNINSYTVRVYDSKTLELVFQNSYQTHENRYFEPNDLFIDNDQNVYVLGKSFLKGKSQKKKNKANYTFILNKISKDKKATLDINLESEHIQSLSISKSNDVFHLIGFYSERNANRIKGSCDFIINENKLSLQKKSLNELPSAVYQDLYGDGSNNNKDRELNSFYLDHVISDSKGNTYLIAEEFYITTTWVANGQFGGTSQSVPHYNDIIVLKVDSNGKLLWGRSIFKRSGQPSYNAFLKNDKLYLILNSGKKLVKKKDGRTKVSQGFFESSALYNIVFTEEGKVTYEKIRDNKKKTKYSPFYGTYKNNRFIMSNTSLSQRRFMLLE